jgi:hypothetical protein
MPLCLALHPAYCKHFRDRVQQRYGLLIDRYVIKDTIDAMILGLPSPNRIYIENRSATPVAHQEVWWLRFDSKWVLTVFDPKERKLVTTLPPETFPPPHIVQQKPVSIPRLSAPWTSEG